MVKEQHLMKRIVIRYIIVTLLCGTAATVIAQDKLAHRKHAEFSNQSLTDNVETVNIKQGIKIAFELEDSLGNLVTEDHFKGKYVLMTFGFTQCADICPMIAAHMARVLNSVTNVDRLGVFVSVDTERDTPKITNRYASGFHEDMLGLAGTYEQLTNVANNFKVSYSVTKTQQHYTVQHSTNIYLIGPDGNLVDIFAMNTPIEIISTAMN